MNRRKMIKSTGNAADPLFAFSELDVDAMCFYPAHEGCIANDGDYGAPTATTSYKKGYKDGWGKLAGCIRMRKFNLQRAFIRTVEINPPRLPLEDHAHNSLLRKTPPLASDKREDLHPNRALKDIMKVFTKSFPIPTQ